MNTDAVSGAAAAAAAALIKKSKTGGNLPVVFNMVKYLETVPGIFEEGVEELEQLMKKKPRTIADNIRASALISSKNAYNENMVSYIQSLQEQFNDLGFVAAHGSYVLVELGHVDDYAILGDSWAFALFQKPKDETNSVIVLDL